ncbi:GNAT family protein [Prosthecobacter sp.]|uniref:GNAT family N-acetyltransferase n=1 Tax=Prosthecobacter sp. TaxID=1965333 RepID=UPI002AB91191|nr:GNAT family protein [Prosthecobacter sp.]MDZ4404295.1 GNAT family protein [Prosthecobacter sp.]
MGNDSTEPLTGCAQPAPEIFAGRFITLTPLDVVQDVEELFAISHADNATRQLWCHMPRGPFADVHEHAAFLREWQATPNVIAFTVCDTSTQRILGSISLMSIRAEHGVAELGNIWYAPAAQRTKANTEACFLLLRHCFEKLRYRRMEWKCDARNERSRRAALRLGFMFEGIFRQHMIIKGENRDTAWFAMLDHEWPRIGAAMHRWLYEDDSFSLARIIGDGGSVLTRA